MKKRSIRLLLSALLVLVMAFQSFAAPLSYAGPTAASEPAKITGTWSTDASGSWRFNASDGAAKDGWYYLNTTNNATDYNWFCFDANGVMRTGWVPDKNDPSVWYYTGESKDSSEGGLVKGWITDPQDGQRYYLDPSTGIMCHGWKQVSGVWYYFGESRYADRKWAPDTTGYWKAGASGKHSYGSLYMNEYTPDGYYVGANGAWVQNHSEDDNSDKPDPIPEYSITVENDGNGTASASAKKSAAGKEITLTATPKEGYRFKEWNVVSGGITVAGNKFTMPANNVTVKAVFEKKEVPVTSVSLDKTEVTIEVGDEDVKLSAIVLPENATDKSVNWSSSDTDVATVDQSGKVHAVAAGDATITVTTVDGNKTDTCAVKVTAPATYTVTFDLNGATGTAPTAQTIASGSKVTKPTDPTFANHTFAGWYKTKDATTGALSDLWNFDTDTVTADMTLYAQWTRTMQSILDTNTEGIAKSDNLVAPANAWVNSTNSEYKAFVGKDDEEDTLFVVMKEGQKIPPLGLLMDDEFIRINKDTYKHVEEDLLTVTANMTDGKFTSCKWKFILSNYQFLNGTYVPAGTTFKAVYNTTGDANTLTFYYDAVDHSGEGTVYDSLPTAATKQNSWGYDGDRSKIKSVVIDSSVAGYDGLTSTAYMFFNMNNAQNIKGAGNLDVSNVKDMTYMFGNYGGETTELTEVPDVSKWNTSNVENMKGVFYSYARKSKDLAEVPDVSKWNTSNVTSMESLFDTYGHFSTILNKVPNVSEWDTLKVTNMYKLFNSYAHESKDLTEVPDVGKWKTGSVTNMSLMFNVYGHTSIELNDVPNVSDWNTSKVEKMNSMFVEYGHDSKSLEKVPIVSDWDTTNVKEMELVFKGYGYNSTKLKDVPDVSKWNTGNVTNMKQMFDNYGNVSKNISCVLNLSGWDLSKITETNGIKVFNFNPKTFDVTIPAKTGDKDNDSNNWYYGNGTNHIEPPTGKLFTLPDSKNLMRSASGGQTHDAPMAETEVSEPTAEVFEPEFEPEKFEEAKPEELIEPAEAVAEEAAS